MDVKDTILSLKNSSPCYDELPASIAKQCIDNDVMPYGIRGTILKWLESYLSDQVQFGTFDGTPSEVKSVNCGVPQGSILVPLLFNIYINDLYNVSEFLITILYADDACVLLNVKHLDDLII